MVKSPFDSFYLSNGDLTPRPLLDPPPSVSDALSGGDKFTLVGFGTFSGGERSQREGRNPRTCEVIKIAASKVVKFKAGKTLSEKVQ